MVTKCICKTCTVNWTTDWQLEDWGFLHLHVQLLNIVTLLIWLPILYCSCSRIKVIVHTFSSENMLLYVCVFANWNLKFEVKSFVQYNQIWISVVQLEVSVGPVTRMFICMHESQLQKRCYSVGKLNSFYSSSKTSLIKVALHPSIDNVGDTIYNWLYNVLVCSILMYDWPAPVLPV